jgi:hypothetical protein
VVETIENGGFSATSAAAIFMIKAIGCRGTSVIFSLNTAVDKKKNVYFVKLLKCVTDFTIAFLSSRWLKKIYGTFNLGSG